MLVKYATCEEILEVKTSASRLDYEPGEGQMFSKFASIEDNTDVDGGYVYVRTRAISSRVNKNNDGWPSTELASGYRTFVGRPIFVDHNNNDPRRSRGVVVDSVLHVEDGKHSALDPYYSVAPENHKPPTWVELLHEVDGQTFPKLAAALKSGKLNATSMGANIERSICSVCGNEARVPSEYCSHIRSKGSTFEVTADNGQRVKKKAYEDCYGVNFFEDSFVFDPADETALNIEVTDTQPAPFKQSSVVTAALPPLDESQKAELSQEIAAVQSGAPVEKQSLMSQIMSALNTPLPYESATTAAGIAAFFLHHYFHLGSYNELMSPVTAADVPNSDNDRQLNHEPQDDKLKAPQKVDTLRNDIQCPNCEADVLAIDPDGVQRCPTCGYEQPPEGLDDPDLSKARELDKDEILNGGSEGQDDDVVKATDEDAADDEHFIKPLGPSTPVKGSVMNQKQIVALFSATNNDVPTRRISEMNWTTKIATDDIDEANEALTSIDKIAASVETQIQSHAGIHFGTHAAAKAAGVHGSVVYPGAPGPLPIGEGANPMQHFMYQMKATKEQGLSDPGQLTVTVDAPDNEIDQLLHIIHTGGESGLTPGDAGAAPGAAAAPPAPTASTKEADRRVIKREESPDGHKTEQIIEETGGLEDALNKSDDDKEEKPEDSEEKPEGEETQDPQGGSEPSNNNKPDFLKGKQEQDPQKKLLAAMMVAEEAVELGLISKEKKLAFIGKLEQESLEQIDPIEAVRRTLALVKSASLTKKVTGHKAISSVPRLGAGNSLNGHSKTDLDDIPFEAIFLS